MEIRKQQVASYTLANMNRYDMAVLLAGLRAVATNEPHDRASALADQIERMLGSTEYMGPS